MQALVIYDSQFGNTERIARTIAASVRECVGTRLMSAAEAAEQGVEDYRLLIIGGPTQMRHASPALTKLIEGFGHNTLEGCFAATFDTRMHIAKLISGSAAESMAKQLKQAGCHIIAPPHSFFVSEREGPLEEGEIERASEWAHWLVEHALEMH